MRHSRGRADTLTAAAVYLAGYPTPMAKEAGPDFAVVDRENSGGMLLPAVAAMTGWSTASARDWKDSEGMSLAGRNQDGTGRERTDQLPRQAMLSGWATTNTCDATRGSPETPEQQKARGANVGMSLIDQAALMTPARLTACGRLLIGSSAAMESGGQLSPEHSRLIMRIPAEWASCAPTETASTLKRSRKSAT
jgi:hypothetical protein